MRTVLHLMELIDGNGGGPRVLLNLATSNQPKNSRLIYITYQPSPLQSECEKPGVEFHNLATLSAWRLIKGLMRVLRQSRAEIMVTHHTRPLLAGYVASKLTGIPFIHYEHSSAHYHTPRKRFLSRWCLSSAKAVVCTSHYSAKTITKTYRLKGGQVRVLYNPVEKRKMSTGGTALREELKIGRNEIVLGHVGGMIPERDHATLIQAFHRFHKRYPFSRLFLIGDGPVRPHLEAQTAELKLKNKILFTGYTDRVGDYLDAMDIYINSTLEEGFGIAAVEAMLAEKPVILANAGAHPELIRDGEQGVLYPGRDAAALEKAMMMLTENRDQSRRMAASAREMAQVRFAPDGYAVQFRDLVEEVIKGGQAKLKKNEAF